MLNPVRDGTASAWELGLLEETVPYLVLGHRLDEAFEILTRGIQLRVVPPYDWLVLDPRLAALRGDRRFAAVLAPARAQFEDMKGVLEDARTRGDLPPHLDKAVAEVMRDLPRADATIGRD
jgi:hypothetical protein